MWLIILDDGRSSSDTLIQESNQRTWQLTPPLDLNYDLFMDQDIYKVLINIVYLFVYLFICLFVCLFV